MTIDSNYTDEFVVSLTPESVGNEYYYYRVGDRTSNHKVTITEFIKSDSTYKLSTDVIVDYRGFRVFTPKGIFDMGGRIIEIESSWGIKISTYIMMKSVKGPYSVWDKFSLEDLKKIKNLMDSLIRDKG